MDLRPNFDFISLRSKVGRYVGPHIVPLVRYGPMTGSHVSGRLPPRHVRLPLARGPLPVFYRSEAERLASFSWQIKTRHVEPSDRLSCLSTRSFERRNTYVGHGWQRWKPTPNTTDDHSNGEHNLATPPNGRPNGHIPATQCTARGG